MSPPGACAVVEGRASAVGFAFAGLVATSFPLQLPWLPLVAPVAVVGVYVLATRPFVR